MSSWAFRFSGERVTVKGAGRTDAGVHAVAQVAHLRLARYLEPAALGRFTDAVNQQLPGGIHLLAVEPAHPRFHARHDAAARSYVYQLARRRTAFAKRYVWWVKEPLDVARLRQAAERVPGRHDFRLFCQSPAEQASTLVEVERLEVAEDGELVLLRITASHFLWRMVRRLVGALVQVGTGQLSLAELDQLIAGTPLPEGRGEPGQWTAPASGLFLARVLYPGDPPLPPLEAITPVPRFAPVVPTGPVRDERPPTTRPPARKPPPAHPGRPRKEAPRRRER